MTYKITEANLIDTRAALVLADRLIAFDPNNAHYQYIKGWIRLKPPRDLGCEQDALKQFELGNKLDKFYLPYSNFRQRVNKLSDRARINPLKKRLAEPSETDVYFELTKFISRAYGVYPKLDRESFRRLSAAVALAAEKLINHARRGRELSHGDILLISCEGARLRYLDLAPIEAQQARFRLARSKELSGISGKSTITLFITLGEIIKITTLITVCMAFFFPPMFPLVWLFLVIVNTLRGRAENISVGVKTPLLFVVGLIAFYGLIFLYGYLNRLLPGRFLPMLVFVVAATIMWFVLTLSAPIRPADRVGSERSRRWISRICRLFWIVGAIVAAAACSLFLGKTGFDRNLIFFGVLLGWSVFCVLVWIVIVYRHLVFRSTPSQGPLNNRFAQLLLVLLPMVGMIGLFRPVPVAPWILAFFTVLLIGLVTTYTPVNRLACLRAARHIFSRESQIVVARTKMARIMSTILLIAWIVLLAAVHLSANKWSNLKRELTDTLSVQKLLPEANRETYERVLSNKYSDDPNANPRAGYKEDVGLPMELHLASPEDLRAIINERQAEDQPIREEMLLKVMWQGGHDVHPVIVKALKDPNAFEVLIRRAKRKEASVKGMLERIFKDKMAELNETIAPIREDPNNIRSLIIRHAWEDETAKRKLHRTFQTV